MNARRTWFGLALGFLVLVALAPGLVTPTAGAQKARAEPRYAYKVVCLRYNPGERLGDDARARSSSACSTTTPATAGSPSPTS